MFNFAGQLLVLAFAIISLQLVVSSALADEPESDSTLAGQFSSDCQQLRLVSRRAWGAKGAQPNQQALKSFAQLPRRVFVHQAWDGRSCADLDSCSVRLQAIQAYHQHSKKWPDISYNFLISADGTIYEGVGFHLQGFHTLNYNQESFGVALIGTYQDVQPSQQMEESLATLISCLVQSNRLASNYTLHGHRDARCTICPGEAAYARLASMPRFQPGPLAAFSCPVGLAASQMAQREPPRLVSAAVQQAAPVESLVEEAIVGVLRRRKTTSGGQIHKRQVAAAEDQQQVKAPVKVKPSEKRLVVVNLQQVPIGGSGRATQQAAQPIFYVLTNGGNQASRGLLAATNLPGSNPRRSQNSDRGSPVGFSDVGSGNSNSNLNSNSGSGLGQAGGSRPSGAGSVGSSGSGSGSTPDAGGGGAGGRGGSTASEPESELVVSGAGVGVGIGTSPTQAATSEDSWLNRILQLTIFDGLSLF